MNNIEHSMTATEAAAQNVESEKSMKEASLKRISQLPDEVYGKMCGDLKDFLASLPAEAPADVEFDFDGVKHTFKVDKESWEDTRRKFQMINEAL